MIAGNPRAQEGPSIGEFPHDEFPTSQSEDERKAQTSSDSTTTGTRFELFGQEEQIGLDSLKKPRLTRRTHYRERHYEHHAEFRWTAAPQIPWRIEREKTVPTMRFVLLKSS